MSLSNSKTEQIKLRANYVNGLAVALAAVGGISPAIAVSRTITQWSEIVQPISIFLAMIFFSYMMHRRACIYLGSLDVE